MSGQPSVCSPLEGTSAGSGAVRPANEAVLAGHVADWNPFGDDSFNQLNEDHLFGAEFDKIRRGSKSSKFYCYFLNCERCHSKFTE